MSFSLRTAAALRRVIFSIFVLAVLTGCAGRAMVAFIPDAQGVGTAEPVFVASTRVFENGEFTGLRNEGLSFVSFDVSIPPDRESGEVLPVRERDRRIDPETQFLVTRADGLAGPGAFRRALQQNMAIRTPGGGEVMVFVHGYNTSFADGLYRTAQIRHDFNIPGTAVHYAWPSAAHPLGYAYDRDSALFARDGLEQLLTEIAAAGSQNIVLVAHSLGSGVTMEALRQIRIAGRHDLLNRISGVILMSPDIDIDVFRSQAMRLRPLPQPFVIFTSERDRALRLSATITGQQNRLGNIGTVEDVADLEVTLIDVSEFRGGAQDNLNHSTALTSPAVIQILRQLSQVNSALEGAPDQQIGLLPGTVLTVRNATQVILQPNAP